MQPIEHVDEAGPAGAPAIVLVHGSVVTRKMWLPQLIHLSDAYHVLAPDLPGHGTLAQMPFTFAGAAQTLHTLIDSVAGGQAIVVGASMGGYVAIDFAHRFPQNVAGLVLAGASRNLMGAVGLYVRMVGGLMRRGWIKMSRERAADKTRRLFPPALADVADAQLRAGVYPEPLGAGIRRDGRPRFPAAPGRLSGTDADCQRGARCRQSPQRRPLRPRGAAGDGGHAARCRTRLQPRPAGGLQSGSQAVREGGVRVSVRLRTAAAADRPFLWTSHCATMRQAIEQTWGWDDVWQRADFERRFNESAVTILDVEGVDAGCLWLESRPGSIYVSNIQVLPPFQRNGIATTVLRELQSRADARGLTVALAVLEVNGNARRLYERLHFTITSVRTPFIDMQYGTARMETPEERLRRVVHEDVVIEPVR